MTGRAFLSLRPGVHYRREAFATGLARVGFEVHHGMTDRPKVGDILVIWNRYAQYDAAAKIFERHGLPVLVAENGYLGNELAGERWYALALSHHNGAGAWPKGGPERWDSLGIELEPFRPVAGGECILLPQRGIGPAGVAMPRNWQRDTERQLRDVGMPYRVRPHPGTGACVPLEVDLARAGAVLTWGSGAALKALQMGVSVFSDFPKWVGRQDNTDAGRIAMFRRLAWAQWRLSEISNGEAFKWLLA